jgi:hypothetical protein
LAGNRLQIKALGEWRVRRDGKPAVTGKNMKIVLHALVLSRGSAFREDLADLLSNPETVTTDRDQAVRNTLTKLRDLSLEIPPGENPVILSATQPHATIDLWEFFAHVRFKRYEEAYKLISDGQEPYLLAGADDRDRETWKKTFDAFYKARSIVIAERETRSSRRHSMEATRARLKARSLVPGVGQAMPIGNVRQRLEHLKPPWSLERPDEKWGKSLISDYLASILTQNDLTPSQIIVVGRSGAGKTITAISSFLKLTDPLEDDPSAQEFRTVLYIDPEAEGSQPEFGSDSWFAQRLHEADGEDSGRPIVIMPHADAFLSRHQSDLKRVLDSRLFRDSDILLCCGAQLFSRRLAYEEFGTHVVHLEPWNVTFQKSFASALSGKRKCDKFASWLEQDPTRQQLCSVPLHMVHVLSLLGEDSDALAEISTPPQLFDGVARMRLRVAGHTADEDQMMQDLAALAHRFYVDATPADAPIRLSPEELKLYLRARGHRDVEQRADVMINRTLLTISPPGSDTLRFEDPSWAWFFVAWHIVHTLLHRPYETLEAFSKLLSANMAILCEEMLREKLEHYEGQIHSSLTLALHGEAKDAMDPERLTIARTQVGYLLGVLGDRAVHEELSPLVEAGSSAREPDDLVRRGIVLGLADGGAEEFSDTYVEELAAERGHEGATPERDANIGFLLSTRGDQAFDPELPGKIGHNADPIRTVGDLVQGLADPRHSGSWRIQLFTLVDLGLHPAISRESFSHAITLHRDHLEAVLARLQGDRKRREWPELVQLGQLLGR